MKYPALILLLPVSSVPAIFTPVPVTTTMFALPTALIVMLPFAVSMFTLLFPLLILAPPPPAAGANTPLPYNTLLVLPVKLTVAILPIPTTLATATLFAVAA